MSEKLQKVLARVGLGSRRYMEEVIAAGRVSVNGQVAQVGERIEPGDELRIDGRKVSFQIEDEIRRRVLIYYKPEGEICSRSDPESRPTVFEQLPAIANDRWVMVGRLDINSTGLLLFTNDGELANRLMHPSNEIEREYAVRVMGEVTPQIKNNMLKGVVLDDGPAKFESFSEIGGEGINRWFQVVVKEGRNREVRRIFESQGLKVSRLLRTRYGTVILPRELRTGRWMELDKNDIDNLTKAVELKPRQGTGLYGMAKRRTERMQEKPMAARRGGFLRQQRRDNEDEGQQQAKPAFNRERRENPNGHSQRRQDNAQTGYGQREQRQGNTGSAQREPRQNSGYAQRDSRPENFGNKGTYGQRDTRDENAPRKPFGNKGFKKF
ncbi:pseudouridine synthase [Acinetobacter johnsonii]|jgi:23S rRNA pseudouridine2605 synthase|uniref:Pseudouridine synthase n=1 Tax=Acinetobacter johnsonii TaxID=40214 RepID=A0A2W5AEK3_ACIJO|nr:MAG: ribosomal large subunit pseudouridine synthase B [Acinetobacter johnsonii]RSE21851.1 pseudouridine synthase [Acinetobacter johnsonii]